MPDWTVIEVLQLGVNDTSATIVEWYVADGDRASVGEPICSLETTKAVFDVEAETSGYLVHLAAAGAEVMVSQAIALVGPDLEQLQAEQKVLASSPGGSGSQAAARASEGPATATRKAIEAADRLGVDLADVVPSGAIVSESDVVRHVGSAIGGTRHTAADVSWESAVEPVAVYGAGRGAVTVKDCLDQGDGPRVVCFLDDDPAHANELLGLPVLDGSALADLQARGVRMLACAIANGAVRLRIRQQAHALGITVISVIHPTAYVARSAEVGAGSYVKAGAIIETNTVVGECCIVDNGVVVAHDNVIGDGCHLAPGVAMGSSVTVGDLAVVGIGASVATGIRIGRSAIVGPGSAVVKDVPDMGVVEGVPARVVGKRRGGRA